jgi:hypothetical protein
MPKQEQLDGRNRAQQRHDDYHARMAANKRPFIERARELLVDMPREIRGDGGLETHLLGIGGNAPTFRDDDVLWGLGGSYRVYTDYDNHEKRYTRVWCYFQMSPWENGLSLDVTEALN